MSLQPSAQKHGRGGGKTPIPSEDRGTNTRWFPWRVRSRVGVAEGGGACACACEREVGFMVAFVCCCFACDCVLELVCRVRFARVSCPWLRFVDQYAHPVWSLL